MEPLKRRSINSSRFMVPNPSPGQRLQNHMVASEANIRTRKTLERGAHERSVLVKFKRGSREFWYHATKGWRSNRVPA